MSSSLYSRMFYKKERVGVVEKDGKTYIKYAKVSRFKVSKDVKHVLLSVFILLVLGLGLKLLLSELVPAEPVAVPTEPGV